MHILTNELINNSEDNYKSFTKKLVPDTELPILGVRVPKIKIIAKKYSDINLLNEFLSEKHVYYEEYFLHGIIIGQEKKDINKVLHLLDEFIPYIDNWAICDSTVSNLKIINKYPKITLEKIKTYLKSNKPYTVRFGIVCLLNYYLDHNFSEEILSLLKNTVSDNYYVNMATSWALSVAVIKQPKSTITLLESKTLPRFVQNKTIQKSIESYRVPADNKKYLKTLKI